MRSCLLLSFAVLAAGAACAQEAREPLDPRRNQKIERIVIEDAGARVDELRVGGQAESITVKPAGTLPAYEIQPPHLARARPQDERAGLSGSGGQRVWNVFGF